MVEAQKVETLPTVEAILALPGDSPDRAEKTCRMLSRLLAGLESADERHLSVRILHDLAAALEGKSLPHLILRAMPVPGLDRPIRLLLTPAVFSPEMWGQTFAEGLMKVPEQFDGTRVVELGTGSGWISLLLLLRTNVQEVVGLDINPVAVTMARLNAWLNGTRDDGSVVLSQAGAPIVGAFRIVESDLLQAVIAGREDFDHVIGCIPQVLHPEGHAETREPRLSERELYDLSNYCFEQGILEDRFGLPLIARALEQAQVCLKRGGKVTLILGGRPGPDAIASMFVRRGYEPEILWSRRITQADDTDLKSLVKLEQAHGIKFHFFMSRNSRESLSAETAVRMLQAGHDVYHDLLVYRATTAFEKAAFGFASNLHRMSLDSLRKELDFSRMTEEQMSFLDRLSQELLKSRTIPYPHERGDLGLRKRLSKFLRIYCHLPVEADEMFVAPERSELLSMIVNMVAKQSCSVLLSESLREVYGRLGQDLFVDTVWCNDDLSEILELDDVLAPSVVVLAPRQFVRPSPIVLSALFDHARKHPDSYYVIDDSANFEIGSQLDANMMIRLAGQMDLPENVVLLYGLIKNVVAPDLELSFVLNAPPSWIEGFDVASELTYSRIPYPSQLYYEWLFDDLLSFPFPVETIDSNYGNRKKVEPERAEFLEAASDPVFAPKPVDVDDPELIRLDYGEFEHPVPDLLVRGIIKGFVEPDSDYLPEVLRYRIASYVAGTRESMILPDRVVLSQGVFPLFGAFLKGVWKRLGRPPRVLLPGGSYGPLYPMIAYHGAQVIPLSTESERGFLFDVKHLRASGNLKKPDVLWLTQPNNPSGLFFESSQVAAIVEWCVENQVYLLADEIFFLLSDHRLGAWTPPSLSFGSHLSRFEAARFIFVTDGLSKAFAAGGLRCGFLVCPDAAFAELIQSHLKAPPAVLLRAWDNLYSAFLDEAPHGMIDVAAAHREVSDYLLGARKTLSANRDRLLSLLRKHGLDDGIDTPYRGGLFLLARLAERRNELAESKKLLINQDDWSRTPSWARLCFSLPEPRFEEAIRRLEDFLG